MHNRNNSPVSCACMYRVLRTLYRVDVVGGDGVNVNVNKRAVSGSRSSSSFPSFFLFFSYFYFFLFGAASFLQGALALAVPVRGVAPSNPCIITSQSQAREGAVRPLWLPLFCVFCFVSLFSFGLGHSLLPGASVAPETRQDPLRASASDTSRATLAAILWCIFFIFCDSIVYVVVVTITFHALLNTVTPHVCQDETLFHELMFVHGP